MNTITALKIEETGNYLVKLHPGTWMIDGKLVTIEGYGSQEVQVKDAKNVRRHSVSSVIVGYESEDETLTVDDYNSLYKELIGPAIYDEDIDNYLFDDIDKEYEYKKFKRKWQPVKEQRESLSEPYVFTEALVKLDTGNTYIQSYFSATGDFSDVYTYNRVAATMQIVRDTFASLGMLETADKGYQNTANEKSFHVPTHSHVRFIQAFGTYVFNDSWEVKHNPRGTFEAMTKQYEQDKEKYSRHIKVMYNNHFGNKKLDEVSIKRVRSGLSEISSSVWQIDSKQKTIGNKQGAVRKINELIKLLDDLSLESE